VHELSIAMEIVRQTVEIARQHGARVVQRQLAGSTQAGDTFL